MDREAFHQFATLEETHWWFRGRRALYLPVLEHVLRRRLGREPSDLLVVDAGCGTGGFLGPLRRFGTDGLAPAPFDSVGGAMGVGFTRGSPRRSSARGGFSGLDAIVGGFGGARFGSGRFPAGG